MSHDAQPHRSRYLTDFNRSLTEQILENLDQAIRVIELMEDTPSELSPHPLVVARAEIRNAKRYLAKLDMVIDDEKPSPKTRRPRSRYNGELAVQA